MTDASTATNNYAINLEEAFTRKAPMGSPGKSKLRLTPLSKRACLIHGIDPSVLQERDYASFTKSNEDPEISTMK